jgi:hypothetical protein
MVKTSRTNGHSGYNRARLTVIVFLLATNSSCAIASTLHHHYPLGAAPVLFLIPCLLREWDLRGGRPLRGLGSFEWSCFLAGFLFLAVLPLFVVWP